MLWKGKSMVKSVFCSTSKEGRELRGIRIYVLAPSALHMHVTTRLACDACDPRLLQLQTELESAGSSSEEWLPLRLN